MDDLYLTTMEAAEASLSGPRIYLMQDEPTSESWMPPKVGRGQPRLFNRYQLLLLMLQTDLSRWGTSIPFAGKIVTRIAETLFSHPEAAELAIEFHEVGASFVYGVDRGEQLVRCDAAGAAGPARFRLTFDLDAYRAAVAAAFAQHARRIGVCNA